MSFDFLYFIDNCDALNVVLNVKIKYKWRCICTDERSKDSRLFCIEKIE